MTTVFDENLPQTDYKLVKIRDIPQNPTFDVQKFESLITNFETKATDVFIATYVKAGNDYQSHL